MQIRSSMAMEHFDESIASSLSNTSYRCSLSYSTPLYPPGTVVLRFFWVFRRVRRKFGISRNDAKYEFLPELPAT